MRKRERGRERERERERERITLKRGGESDGVRERAIQVV